MTPVRSTPSPTPGRTTRVPAAGGRRVRLGVLGLVLATAGACNSVAVSEPVQRRLGAIAIQGRATSATQVDATATVVVFDVLSAPFPNSSLSQTDQCVFLPVDTTTVVTRGVKRAGASVALQVAGRSTTLPFDAALLRYATPESTTFVYSAGEIAQVTIPGESGTFPAASISVPLVAPILPGAVALPAAGQPLTVTWQPGTDASAAVILSVKYSNPASVPFANEQILCRLRDDGMHTIGGSNLVQLLATPAARRSLTLTRWRTNEVVIDDRTLLHIVSSVDTTLAIP